MKGTLIYMKQAKTCFLDKDLDEKKSIDLSFKLYIINAALHATVWGTKYS